MDIGHGKAVFLGDSVGVRRKALSIYANNVLGLLYVVAIFHLIDVGGGFDVDHDLLIGGVVQLFDVVSSVDSLFELEIQLLGVVAVVVLGWSHTGDIVAWLFAVDVVHNFFVGQLYGPDK